MWRLRNLWLFHSIEGAGDTRRWRMIVCPFHEKCSCYISAKNRMVHLYS